MPHPLTGIDDLALTGRLLRDDATLEAMARDFGGMVRRRPAAVFAPSDAEDLARLVRFAAERGIPVSARGRAHSTNGQTQVSDGIVVDMTSLGKVQEVNADRVVVDAGASWRSVLDATLPRGLTPPVLPDFLDLSVGGTLSLGGIGGTSYRHGAQTDNVLELEVVTGAGKRLTCSPTDNQELFRVAAAGLGQCAIITQATVSLIDAHTHVRRHHLHYPDVGALTAAQLCLMHENRFDYLEGQILPDGNGGWHYIIEAVSFFSGDRDDDSVALGRAGDSSEHRQSETITYAEFANRLGDEETYLSGMVYREQPRPWCTVFLPAKDTDVILSDFLRQTSTDTIGSNGLSLVYPIPTMALTNPLLRVPKDPVAFQLSVFRFAEPGDARAVDTMLAANRALYDQARSVGGTVYPFGSVPFSQQDWRAHLGSHWKTLDEAKALHDPRRILNCGQGIF